MSEKLNAKHLYALTHHYINTLHRATTYNEAMADLGRLGLVKADNSVTSLGKRYIEDLLNVPVPKRKVKHEMLLLALREDKAIISWGPLTSNHMELTEEETSDLIKFLESQVVDDDK